MPISVSNTALFPEMPSILMNHKYIFIYINFFLLKFYLT